MKLCYNIYIGFAGNLLERKIIYMIKLIDFFVDILLWMVVGVIYLFLVLFILPITLISFLVTSSILSLLEKD